MPSDRQFLEQLVVAKYWQDEDFQELATSSPREAIVGLIAERAPEFSLPDDLEIHIEHETAEQLFIIVPNKIEDPKTEISDVDKTSMGRKDVEHVIASRASADPDFKQSLQLDPKATLTSALQELDPNMSLPDNLTVSLIEESENQVYLVVPPNPADLEDVELTEEQLEAVAGGIAAVAVFVVGAVAVAVGAAAAAAVNVTAAVNINEAVNVHHVATAVKSADESPW
tara:strand:- start:275 stop:955 length:681 start_codon:yes stop_codon:yes gene_type:complete